MSLWWLQPGWSETPCACCGQRIAPEGDPDWGLCWGCMQAEQERQFQEQQWLEEQRRLETEAMEQHFREHPHG